ncbi:MAG: radical SAM protein [Patescibacteria group bacterium]|nr:radical SAM protein [Patescibacteria group bacterium]
MNIEPSTYHRRLIGDRIYYVDQLSSPNLIQVSQDADEVLHLVKGPSSSNEIYKLLQDRISDIGELEFFLDQCVSSGLLKGDKVSHHIQPGECFDEGEIEYKELESYSIERRIPIGGSIELTTSCNLRCIHCYLGDERTAKSNLDLLQWLDYVNQILDLGCIWVELTGGDPLLSPYFPSVYRKLVEEGAVVTVLTNGTTLRDEHLELFSELPPAKVEVSIYGFSPEVYEEVTGIPGSYDKFRHGVSTLAAIGIKTELKAILLKANVHEYESMRAFAEENGAFFRFSGEIHEELGGSGKPNRHRLAPRDVVQTDFCDPQRAAEIKSVAMDKHSIKDLDAYQCRAGTNGFHIAPTGMVHPCITERAIGFSLKDHSFRDIWENRLSQAMTLQYQGDEKCVSCNLHSMCKICPARARMATGNPLSSVPYLCALAKERVRMSEGRCLQ